MSKISIQEYSKALDSLSEALKLFHSSQSLSPERKAFRDAAIQRFEYCIELSWKLSLKLMGSNTQAAKPAIREMARSNIISNPEDWLSFIDARNDTSHSYDDDIAAKVFKTVEKFYPEAKKLELELKKLI